MKLGLLSGLILLATVFACSSNDSSGTPSDDPEELAQQVADAWSNIDGGFHVTFDTNDSTNSVVEADYVSSELMGAHIESGKDKESCTTITDSNGDTREQCQTAIPGSSHQDEYTYDSFLTKRGYLYRTCEDDDCSGYAFFPYDFYGAAFFGIGQQFPIASLDQILSALREPTIVSADEDGLVHLAAKFTAAQIALDEAIDFVERHELDLGSSCDNNSISFSINPFDSATPSPTPDCHDFTSDDFREANQTRVENYDREPAPIDIWISRETLLPDRIRFSQPQSLIQPPTETSSESTSSDATEFDFHFSQYGDVTVDIPKLEIE